MDNDKVTNNGIIVPRLYYMDTKDLTSVLSVTERTVIKTMEVINRDSHGKQREVLELTIKYLNKNLKKL